MEKTININGREIKQKVCARNAFVYRDEFSEDIAKAYGMFQGSGVNGQVVIERLNMERMMRLVWTMEKTAVPETPAFEKWVSEIDYFPLLEAYTQIVELITLNLTTITTIKNADAAAENGQPKA
jgi:hypothetical protein